MECRNVANVCDAKSLRYLCMVSVAVGDLANFESERILSEWELSEWEYY